MIRQGWTNKCKQAKHIGIGWFDTQTFFSRGAKKNTNGRKKKRNRSMYIRESLLYVVTVHGIDLGVYKCQSTEKFEYYLSFWNNIISLFVPQSCWLPGKLQEYWYSQFYKRCKEVAIYPRDVRSTDLTLTRFPGVVRKYGKSTCFALLQLLDSILNNSSKWCNQPLI